MPKWFANFKEWAALILVLVTIVSTLVATSKCDSGNSSGETFASNPNSLARTEFLGEGKATLSAPVTMRQAQSKTVVLTVTLERTLKDSQVTWGISASGSPTIKVSPPTVTQSSQPVEAAIQIDQGHTVTELPIYSRMRARLDAPTFSYIETNEIWKDVKKPATWVWNIVPKSEASGPQNLSVVLQGPEGSDVGEIFQITVDVQAEVSTVTPTATATAVVTPTATATAVVTPTATATAVVTPTATATAVVTPTATATAVVTPTATATAVVTPTVTATAIATSTATATATTIVTSSVTATAVATPTPTPEIAATSIGTSTATGTPPTPPTPVVVVPTINFSTLAGIIQPSTGGPQTVNLTGTGLTIEKNNQGQVIGATVLLSSGPSGISSITIPVNGSGEVTGNPTLKITSVANVTLYGDTSINQIVITSQLTALPTAGNVTIAVIPRAATPISILDSVATFVISTRGGSVRILGTIVFEHPGITNVGATTIQFFLENAGALTNPLVIQNSNGILSNPSSIFVTQSNGTILATIDALSASTFTLVAQAQPFPTATPRPGSVGDEKPTDFVLLLIIFLGVSLIVISALATLRLNRN